MQYQWLKSRCDSCSVISPLFTVHSLQPFALLFLIKFCIYFFFLSFFFSPSLSLPVAVMYQRKTSWVQKGRLSWWRCGTTCNWRESCKLVVVRWSRSRGPRNWSVSSEQRSSSSTRWVPRNVYVCRRQVWVAHLLCRECCWMDGTGCNHSCPFPLKCQSFSLYFFYQKHQ